MKIKIDNLCSNAGFVVGWCRVPPFAESDVAIVSADALYGFLGVIENQGNINDFYQVISNDEYSIHYCVEVEVGSEDPVVVAAETVPTAHNKILASIDHIVRAQ